MVHPRNLTRLDLRSIELFALGEQHGSLSAGARAANYSISGTAHRLKKFEEWIGQQLFQRHSREMTPTSAGMRAVKHARELLDAFTALCAAAAPRAADRQLQPACSGIASLCCTPPAKLSHVQETNCRELCVTSRRHP
jgi:DNA-binding transcriptional LysR family regulator